MKLFDFFRKNNLDEMQEQKMLKIEHNGFWLLYWGLFAALLIQAVLYRGDLHAMTGELILLMAASVYVIIAELRAGLWSRNLKPNLKTNMVCSLVGAALVFVFSVVFYLRMEMPVWMVLLFAAIGAVCTFGLTLFLLQICAGRYRKRRSELDISDDDEK